MSAPTSLHLQPNQFQMKATSGGRSQQDRMAANKQNDLIETKFNQLARKILAELQPNTARGQQFFVALDSIIQEPNTQSGPQKSPSGGRLSRSGSKKQLAEQQQDLTRKCDILLAKQKLQQDQLDSHQQILFDKQYESLPAEISGSSKLAVKSQAKLESGQRALREGVRKTATTSKLPDRKSDLELANQKVVAANEKLATSPTGSAPTGQRQRSAIPTSTILAGINQLSKSATTGSFGTSNAQPSQFSRQLSLRLKSPQQLTVPSSQQLTRESEVKRSQLTASEKLKQRRPTKATIMQQAQVSIDTDDDDDDDDDDSYEYHDLASRRAHLNERFIQPAATNASQPVTKSKTFSELKTVEPVSRLAPPQQQQQQHLQRQQQVKNVVRSQTSAVGAQSQKRHADLNEDDNADDDDDFDDESEGPRSINGLLTSQSGNMMYKPHMNYSQSLLGNHRLSDDDEIIIIPTAHSPTPSLLMSASPSPIGGRSSQLHRAPQSQVGDQEPAGNLDEFNERFSISRTKSFWEKLAGSKKIVGEPPASQIKQQQQNDVNNNNNNNNKLIQQHHSSAPNKSAFDRLDSTGGSGNSYHSGCSSNSSTSGDDHATAAAAAYANRHLNPLLVQQKQSTLAKSPGARQQSTWAAPNPTVKQLVSQEQMQRSDKFRQTR